MNRREFFKFSGLVIATAAVSKIPLNLPYKLPYWKDLIRVGEPAKIVYRFNKYGASSLTVNGVECDPRDDFCVTEDRIQCGPMAVVGKHSEGTVMYDFTASNNFKNWMLETEYFVCLGRD